MIEEPLQATALPDERSGTGAKASPEEFDPDLGYPPEWTTRAGRRTMSEKLAAGLRGLKYAVRGDSSFFAHAYRSMFLIFTAAFLGLHPMSWCLIVMALVLVLIAELAHSAIDTLARALGDPEEIGLKVAREIATAGVLVAVLDLIGVVSVIFTLRIRELLSGL